jgi:hypothetical protein
MEIRGKGRKGGRKDWKKGRKEHMSEGKKKEGAGKESKKVKDTGVHIYI